MKAEHNNLLLIWETDLRIICHAHYEAATSATKRNYQLGVPVIVLSAIVGTAIFVSLEKSPQIFLRILFGLLSIAAVVFSSLQTFLKWSERAEKHREAGARFGSLLKEIEQKIACFPNEGTEFEKWCHSFRQRWDNLSLDSPTIPKIFFEKHIKIEKDRFNNLRSDI